MAENEIVPVQGGSMKLRLPYPKTALEIFQVDDRTWQVLVEAVWPAAKTVQSVMLALAYCKSRNLDPLKRPIHIVPVWSKTGGPEGKGGEIETIWPGISELRTTAVRTGVYAGKDASEFGDEITETFQYIDDRNDAVKEQMEVTFPEWCRVTVYRIVHGTRCPFVGPKVYWKESYASKSRFNAIPNEMWADRKSGQLEKCAEAAALRAAFPEELGNEYTAEEMAGQVIDGVRGDTPPADRAIPPRPQRSEFERGGAHQPKPDPKPAQGQAPKVEPTKQETPAPKPTPQPEPEQEPEIEGHAEPGISAAEQQRLDLIADAYKDLAGMASVRQVTEYRESVIDADLFATGQERKAWETACADRNKEIMAKGKSGKK